MSHHRKKIPVPSWQNMYQVRNTHIIINLIESVTAGLNYILGCLIVLYSILFQQIMLNTGILLTGAERSRPGSSMYIYTDADAKDADRSTEVITALLRKGIKPTYALTGQCSRKKRSLRGKYGDMPSASTELPFRFRSP